MDVIIDGYLIKNEQDLHKFWEEKFDMVGNYGRNLNALNDTLLYSIERPIRIVWKDSSLSRERLGIVFDRIIGIFERNKLEDERLNYKDKFTYILE